MTEKLTAIVLDITRHNDKLNVITLYTRSRGRLSFLSPAGAGKNGRLRQARLQPLAVIEADINFRNSSELQRLGSFSLHNVWRDLYFNPIKQLMTLFLSEFLNKLLRATMPDENLWDFIYKSLTLLDNMQTGIGNFHITFLSSLLPFVGIQPDHTQYMPGFLFDMQSGTFRRDNLYFENSLLKNHVSESNSYIPGHTSDHSAILTGEEARFAATLCRLNFSNMRALRLSGQQRVNILQRLLQYYSFHFPGSGNLKSLDIIHELFH